MHQEFGNDVTGQRETFPFKTINAAILAANSGDRVDVVFGVFNEKILAKDQIIVSFRPEASLSCSTASGCVASTAIGQRFTVYHCHKPITNLQAGKSAISCDHSDAYLTIYGDVLNSGADVGGNPYAVTGTNGTIEIFGGCTSTFGTAVGNTAGNASTIFTLRGRVFGFGAAINVGYGVVHADNSVISGINDAAVVMNLATTNGVNVYRNCTLQTTGASRAIRIDSTTANVSRLPILRNCVLIPGPDSDRSIYAVGAQTILLYGQTVAKNGGNPPINITFAGGGTYAVNSSIISDGF